MPILRPVLPLPRAHPRRSRRRSSSRLLDQLQLRPRLVQAIRRGVEIARQRPKGILAEDLGLMESAPGLSSFLRNVKPFPGPESHVFAPPHGTKRPLIEYLGVLIAD